MACPLVLFWKQRYQLAIYAGDADFSFFNNDQTPCFILGPMNSCATPRHLIHAITKESEDFSDLVC